MTRQEQAAQAQELARHMARSIREDVAEITTRVASRLSEGEKVSPEVARLLKEFQQVASRSAKATDALADEMEIFTLDMGDVTDGYASLFLSE